jgi:hypothetical protein
MIRDDVNDYVNRAANSTIENLSATPRSDAENGDCMSEKGIDGSTKITDGEFFRKNKFSGIGENEYSINNVVFHGLNGNC